MVKRNRIAVIPARGGSKRLPRKNIVDFFGKPLIAWSIEAALDTKLFDRVFVSTDDTDIARIARDCGADAPFLRTAFFDDHSTISDVTIHALKQIAQEIDEFYDAVAMLQATCPLRDATDVRAAISSFVRSGADFQMSCFRFGWANPWWAFERDLQARANWLFPAMVGRRSQDQPPVFGLTGAICLAKVEPLLRQGTFYGPDQRFEPIPWTSAVDIDDEHDLAFARAAYLVKHGGSG